MGSLTIEDCSVEAPRAIETGQIAAAQDANDQEHDMTVLQALRLYPKSVFWSITLSTTVVMEGYDNKLVGTLFAQPAFQKHYGELVKGKSYQISAPWQSGLSTGSAAGQVFGLLLAGSLTERFGFRKTMIAGLVVIIGLIFIPFFAPSLAVLEVGQILFGFPLGLFQATAVIYAFEISPLALRPYLTNYVNLCWAFGQLLATGILRALLSLDNHWAYRIPFTLQWVWPVILIPLIYFAPESPWWLVRRGQLQQAEAIVTRLTSPREIDFDAEKYVALMVVTTEHERAVNAQTSYRACFEGVNLRRTLIVIGIYCIQTLNGNPIRRYSTYFLEQAGLPTTQAFNFSVIGFALAIAGGFGSWVFLPLFGRRTIYCWSLVLMLVFMILIGALGVPQATSSNPAYANTIGAILLISSFLYNCTIGPLTNTLCSEIPSAILRSNSIALARGTYTITSIIAGVLTPYQLNPTAWNWGAKTGFFWAGGCVISIVFSFLWVPESKDRSTAEMDILFERKIPERYFSKTQINAIEAIQSEEGKSG